MALYTVTVLGFAAVMGIVGYAILHFFGKAMNSKDSSTIDPKPFQ